MAQTVGSVRITADADTTDFQRELIAAVRDVMRDVMREVTRGMREVNTELGRVDSSGLDEVRTAATAAAASLDEVADEAADAAEAVDDVDGDSLRDVQREAQQAADELQDVTREARQADRAMSAMAGGFGTVAARIRTIGASAALLGGPLLAAAGAAGALGGAVAGIGVLAAPAFAVVKLGMDGIKAAASTAQDSLDSVKASISSTFEQELSGTFDQLGIFLEGFTDELQGVATAASGLFKGVADTVMQNEDAFNQILAGAETFLNTIGPGVNSLTQGFIDFGSAAADQADVLGGAFSSVLGAIGSELSELSMNGSMEVLFQEGAKALEGLADLLGPVIGLFTELGIAVGGPVGQVFTQLGLIIRDITPALAEIAHAFAQAFANALPGLGEMVGGFTDILAALTPILQPIGLLVDVIGTGLGGAMSALAPSVEAIATAFSDALVPIMPILNNLFEKLAPIIGQIGEILAAVLVPVIEVFGELLAGLLPALEPLIDAFGVLVDALQPVIEQIIDAIMPAIEALIPPLVEVATVVGEVLAEAITWVAENILPLLVEAIEFLTPTIQNLATIVGEVFSFIASAIQFAWDNVIKPVFDFIIDIISNVLAPVFMFLWENVVQPVWDGIGAIISGVWTGIIQPAWEGLKAGLQLLGDAFSFVWNDVIKPVWDGLGAGISFVIDSVIKPAWEGMKTALGAVRDFFSDVVGGIGRAWDGLKSLLAKPINFMIGTVWNDGILKAWNVVAGFLPGLEPASPLGLIPEHATGGQIVGPGTGTSDDVLMWGSNGEHMVTALEVIKAGGHNILYAIRDMILRGIPFTWDNGQLINELGRSNLSKYGAKVAAQGFGAVDPEGLFQQLTHPSDADLHKLLPGFATGGAVQPWHIQLARGHEAARMRHGMPYVWGGSGAGPAGTDCSGFMSLIAAAILGADPAQASRVWATGSFPGGQPFVPGLGPGFSVGLFNGGPYGGHTAGTLGAVPHLGLAATNVESGGAHGNVAYGGPATGANDPQFLGGSAPNGPWHLAIGADGQFEPGTGGGGFIDWRPLIQGIIDKIIDTITSPIDGLIDSAVGQPPPKFRGIPKSAFHAQLDKIPEFFTGLLDKVGIGDLFDAYTKAKAAEEGSEPDPERAYDAAVRDRGGSLRSGQTAINLSGQDERVLSPQQTQAFDRLVDWLTGGRLEIDWGGLEDLIAEGIEVYRTESAKQQKEQQSTTTATTDLTKAVKTGGGASVSRDLANAVEEAFTGLDFMSVLDTSALFAGRTVTATAEEVRARQEEEWRKFWEQLQGLCDKEVAKQAAESPTTTTGQKFDLGGVASGSGFLLKDVIAPERVLSPRQTAAFEQLVGSLTGPRLAMGSAGVDGRAGTVYNQQRSMGDVHQHFHTQDGHRAAEESARLLTLLNNR